MPSKVSKTKLRMRMTRTTSVKMESSSQPPAKTMKSSIESYHHVQRQRSQENCSRSSDTNSNTSVSNSKISTKRNGSGSKRPVASRSESNSLPTPINNTNSGSSHNDHSHVKQSRASMSQYHQGPSHHSHEQSGAAGGHPDDKSSQSSNSCDEKHCELDGPIYKRYNIKTRLGKGAYGIVWEAYEKTTGNKVALKKIFDAFRNDTDAQRTYREIMFLREFGSHPNIIRLLNVHRAVNNMDIYLVFPFMEHDLHRLIKESPQLLKDSHIRMVFYQTLKAVKYLHSGEVIHRDLKPANILLDDYLNVKVGDFGLARSLSNPEDTMSETNPIMTDYVATRWYRPPEILLSCPFYTKGVDMWSLGCILAEMILKVPLFPGGSTVHQVETIMGHIAPPSAEEIEEVCCQNVQSTMIESAMVYRKKPLAEIFERSDADTVDIIEKLLVFNPSRRVTAEETLSHPYLARSSGRIRYRRQAEEVTMSHPVSPPLNDYIQLPMCHYRSVIYDLIQVRKVRLQQQQQQQHSQLQQQAQHPQPSSQGQLQQSQAQKQLHYQQEVSESPDVSPVPKSRSYSQPTVTQTAPGVSYSSQNNSNEPRRIRSTNNTHTGVSTTTTSGPNPSASITKPNSRKEKDKECRKSYSTVKTSQTLSREKVLTASSCDHSERVPKGENLFIGPDGDGNGAQKVRTYVGTSHNFNPNPVGSTGDTGAHKPTRKNNSTPNIPQVRKIPGPDGDGHNLPLPYLKLVSTAPAFQGKNPRSELSARTSHPIPSDLRGADKRLFEIFCNTDDLEEEIKAIEFQVRAKRANNSVQAQWITDLSNNLNKATVSDPPNNFTNSSTSNQVLGIANTGRGGKPPGQLQGGNVKGQRHQLTKLPEILQSWNQGHSKMSTNPANTETGAKQPRRSTYFQDPPGQITSSNSGTVKVLSAKGGGLRNVGATRLTQLSPRELTSQQRQGQGSFQNPSGQQQQQLPRSTTPIEVIQARNKHYESYSQTHGTISASDLTELKANLGFLSK